MFFLLDQFLFLFSYHIWPRPRHERDRNGKIITLRVGALRANEVVTVKYYPEPNLRKELRDRTERTLCLKITHSGKPFAFLFPEKGHIVICDHVRILGYMDENRKLVTQELKVGYSARLANMSQGNLPIPIAFISAITLTK